MARRPDLRLLSAGMAARHRAGARELPDVILMDINLPGISGLRRCSILAGDPAPRTSRWWR
jgi:CheY-like chemotaxis protein